MQSFKKILPFIIIAIIFAVGGFFIGRGSLNSQGASLYGAVGGKIYLPVMKPLDVPKSIVKGGVTIASNVTERQCIGLGGSPLYNYNNNPATYYACWVPALSITGDISANASYFNAATDKGSVAALKVSDHPVPTLTESDCIALGGTVVCGPDGDYGGCMLPPNLKGVPVTPLSGTATNSVTGISNTKATTVK